MSVLCFDWLLNDMERFLTFNQRFSVLTVDPQWVSSQIGSHTIAVSEHNDELIGFLDWYVRSGHTPNLSSIAFSGLPKGRGHKGGRPKRQRTRTDLPLPDNYSVRPGLMFAQGSIEQPLLGHARVVRHRDQVQSNIKVTQAPQVNVSGIHHPVSVSIETHQHYRAALSHLLVTKECHMLNLTSLMQLFNHQHTLRFKHPPN